MFAGGAGEDEDEQFWAEGVRWWDELSQPFFGDGLHQLRDSNRQQFLPRQQYQSVSRDKLDPLP